MPPAMNGIRRAGKLTLDAFGTLTGDVQEIRVGDRASSQRWALRTVNKDTDKIKPIETLLSHSLATFEITKASVGNLQSTDLDRKSTRLNSSHQIISYAVFCLKKKKT